MELFPQLYIWPELPVQPTTCNIRGHYLASGVCFYL